MNLASKTQLVVIKILEKTRIFSLLWRFKSLRIKLWNLFAQSGELTFHKTLGNEFRMSDDFTRHTKLFFEKMKYNQNSFVNKNILDIGAGSKLRSLFFSNANIYVIEPLADKFSKLPQSDLHKARSVISDPAEKFVTEFKEKFDFIMCINVLDHCYDDYLVLTNIYKYLNKNGEFLLSVDIHESHNDPMHPVSLTRERLLSNLEKIGFKTKKIFESVGDFTRNELAITLKLTK